MSYGHHDGCAPCDTCGRHLDATETWPCLTCHTPLCDTCECPDVHLEACS